MYGALGEEYRYLSLLIRDVKASARAWACMGWGGNKLVLVAHLYTLGMLYVGPRGLLVPLKLCHVYY